MRIIQAAACAAFLSTSLFAQQTAAPAASTPSSAAPQSSTAEPAIKPPAHPITPAQIAEMQQLSGATALKKRIVDSAIEYYRRSFPPFIPQDVVDDLDKSLQNADLESQAATIYPKYISTEDATTIIAFYKSPAGQHLITAQPYMMTEIQHSAIEVAQQTAKEVITRHKAEIEAAQQKYIQEHKQSKPTLNTQPDSPQK